MTLTLPTTKTKPTTDVAKQSILLYGVPKLGKSSFASQFPEAMFFECEPGLNHLEVFKVPTYSWDAFLEACKLIAKGDHNFKTIVIDTVDSFQVLNRGALMMLHDRRCKSTVSCVCASSMISRKSEVSQQSSVGSEIHRKSQCIHGLDAIRPQSVLAR